jgi:hypothetical protein
MRKFIIVLTRTCHCIPPSAQSSHTNLSYIKLIRKPTNATALFYVVIFIAAFLRAKQAYIRVYITMTLMKRFTKPVTLNIILHVVLYGCETWSLTLREEHRLEVFENRVQRRIFGPKRDEVTGEWKKLHKEELQDLYSSPSISE